MLSFMPKYYFKLVDSYIVAEYGVHQLADMTAAKEGGQARTIGA
jgi:hypothetical protein